MPPYGAFGTPPPDSLAASMGSPQADEPRTPLPWLGEDVKSGTLLPITLTESGLVRPSIPGILQDWWEALKEGNAWATGQRSYQDRDAMIDAALGVTASTAGGAGFAAPLFSGVPRGALLGANVWHGAPRRNIWAPEPGYPKGRPDLGKIKTGEGFLVEGWGFYSGGARGTGIHYRNMDSDPWDLKVGDKPFVELMDDAGIPTRRTIQAGQRLLENEGNVHEAAKFFAQKGEHDTAFALYQMKDEAVTVANQGMLYHLDLPDDAIAKMLLSDAPLGQQTAAIQALPSEVRAIWKPGMNGRDFYRALGRAINEAFANPASFPSASYLRVMDDIDFTKPVTEDQLASVWLRQHDVPGLKYYDAESRSLVNLITQVRVKKHPNGLYEVRAYGPSDGFGSDFAVTRLVKHGEWNDLDEQGMRNLIGDTASDEALKLEAASKHNFTTHFLDTEVEFKGTYNYVTWDQNVLDKMKHIE